MTTRGPAGDRGAVPGPADTTEHATTPDASRHAAPGGTYGPPTGTTTGMPSGVGAGAGTVPGVVDSAPGTPATRTGTTVAHRRDDSPESLREEIEHTRHELGETVAALAAKTDVKSRAKGTARGVMSSAASHAQQLLHPMEERAKHTGRTAKAGTRRLKRKAAEAAESEETRTTARRAGMITVALAGLLLLELLRRRRTAGATGLQRALRSSRRRGTIGRGMHAGSYIGTAGSTLLGSRRRARLAARVTGTGLGTRRSMPGLQGSTHHVAPGLFVRKPRRGVGRRSSLFGGTRHVAPGLNVRNPRKGVRGAGGRSALFGGTRHVAPGLNVRNPRKGVRGAGGRSALFGGTRHVAPGLNVRNPRKGVRGTSRRSTLFGGTRHVAPGLYVRNPRKGVGGLGRRSSLFEDTRHIAPGPHVRDPRKGRGPTATGGAHHIAPGLDVRSPGTRPTSLARSILSLLGIGGHGPGRGSGFGSGFGSGHGSGFGSGGFGVPGGIRFRVRRAGLFGTRPGVRVRTRRGWGYFS